MGLHWELRNMLRLYWDNGNDMETTFQGWGVV